jgi:hypothetical protein
LHSSYKGFDFEILFQGFEKELDLPVVLVNGREGVSTQFKVICVRERFPFRFHYPKRPLCEGAKHSSEAVAVASSQLTHYLSHFLFQSEL